MMSDCIAGINKLLSKMSEVRHKAMRSRVMEQIKKFIDKLLLASPAIYSFLAGISLAIAAHLIAGLALQEQEQGINLNIYPAIGTLLLSSLAFMSLTIPLESARSGWRREESRQQYLPNYIKSHRYWFYPLLFIAMGGLVAGLIVLF